MRQDNHCESGHLNVYVRDQDSVITGYGSHYRVVSFLPDAEGLYCRVDHKHGARMPTSSEILTVARRHQDVRGKWKLDRCVSSANDKTTDFHFVRA